MTPLAPCQTAHLFRPLSAHLLAVLRDLPAADWLRPTVAGAWRIRDVAAHSWAGEQASATWMDIGRDYTEHWHHQMQIRDASAGRARRGRHDRGR